MKKKYLVVLGLLAVLLFVAGCSTGEAVRFGKTTPAQRSQDLMKAKATVTEGEFNALKERVDAIEAAPEPKIISVLDPGYEYLMDAPKKASEVCAAEGLKCSGVVRKYTEEYLGEPNGKVQAVHSYNVLSGSYFCDLLLGVTDIFPMQDNEATEYLEPYAGPVRSRGFTNTVLCS